MKHILWIIPLVWFCASCGLMAGGGLDEAVAAIQRSDLAPDVKKVLIDALKEAWAGNGLLGGFQTLANGALALILAKLGLDKTGLSEKIFGKKMPASEPPKV